MMTYLTFRIILCGSSMPIDQVLAICVGQYSWVQVQAVCRIYCLCCCLITEATGCSKYFKMLLKVGEERYMKTLIPTKSFVTGCFMEIM